jgi:hypothetical protein
MKKNVLLGMLIMALVFGMTVVGCGSAPAVYDKSVPLEQSCTLKIVNSRVTSFNGQRGLGGKNIGETLVIIPAGTHNLELVSRFENYLSNTVTTWSGNITYEFLPGRTYVTTIDTVLNRMVIRDEAEFDQELTPNSSSANATQFEGLWVDTGDERRTILFVNNEFRLTENTGMVYGGKFRVNGNQLSLVNEYFGTTRKWHAFAGWTRALILRFEGNSLKGRLAMVGREPEYRRVE